MGACKIFKRFLTIVIKMLNICWLKTLIFNLAYFPYKTAFKLPVYIYRNVKLMSLNGEIKITSDIKRGMIRIGQYDVGTLDMKYERTIWQNNGIAIFDGSACVGSGSRLSINSGAILQLGDGFCITGRSTLICQKRICFGTNCLLSWDILIMDTDFHKITNNANTVINDPKPIIVGNNVWIGCRNTILKGVTVANNVIIAAGSIITKDISEPNTVVTGGEVWSKSY